MSEKDKPFLSEYWPGNRSSGINQATKAKAGNQVQLEKTLALEELRPP